MKYSIEGISKEKTIKSVELIKKSKNYVVTKNDRMDLQVDKEQVPTKIIAVNYLDGTQDIFEFTEETLKRIEDIMLSQAKYYVDKNSKKLLFDGKLQFCLTILAVLSTVACAFGVSSILLSAGFGILAVSSGLTAIVCGVKKHDVKKYEFFLKQVIDKLENYKQILDKENSLAKSKTPKSSTLSGIMDLDKTPTKSLNSIVTKVERYNEIEGKSPKRKTL